MLSYAYTGYAGDALVRTPHLDRLAQEGTAFRAAYCGAPLCVPSRMTFLSSRHASNIQVWGNDDVLRSDIPTFAHSLGAAGYETILCGRMHFEGPDQRHGFERRLVGDFTRNYPGGPGGTAHTGQNVKVIENAGSGDSLVQQYDRAVTEAACEFLRTREPGGRPWCLVVGYYLPHCPFISPPELFDEYYDRVSIPPEPPLESMHPAVADWRVRRRVVGIPEELVRRARAAYYGMVTLLDQNIGRVLEALEASPHRADTVRIYVSDHGEMAGEKGMWWKNSFYDGSARVPMIWSWPGRIPQGVVRDEVVSLLDVGPTLAELGGAPVAQDVDGRSLAPLLGLRDAAADIGSGADTGRAAWPNEAFSEFASLGIGDPPARMIRRGPWKLVVYHGYHEPQLFNLNEDPEENVDRARDPACAGIRAELWARVHEGWNPEEIIRRVRIRKRDDAILVAWARAVKPPSTDLWRPALEQEERWP